MTETEKEFKKDRGFESCYSDEKDKYTSIICRGKQLELSRIHKRYQN